MKNEIEANDVAEQVTPSHREQRLVRLLRWTAMNGLLVWCAWAAVIQGNIGAGRVLCFAVWFFAVMTWIGACNSELKAKADAKGRSVPAWVSHGFGISLAVLFLWHGWWGCAVAMVLMEMAEAAVYSEPNVPALAQPENQNQPSNT